MHRVFGNIRRAEVLARFYGSHPDYNKSFYERFVCGITERDTFYYLVFVPWLAGDGSHGRSSTSFSINGTN